ncbi:hypothetical protein [Leisingera sp. NJS204]|uniref:hypothetical protein n=1 Tax=Leisingera sp. NJS204 TaxID=2508307 RepID=UPI0020C782B4|nr:hypothetical protein [Leisingera sp. NJS204]
MPGYKNTTPANGEIFSGILWGTEWDAGSLTYSLQVTEGDYGYAFPDLDLFDGFSEFNSAQRAAVKFALEQQDGNSANNGFSVEGFTNLSFSENTSGNGDLRFASSSSQDFVQPGGGTILGLGFAPGSRSGLEMEGDSWYYAPAVTTNGGRQSWPLGYLA